MKPRLVEDVYLPTNWNQESLLNYLHPSHGPLPHLVQIWCHNGKHYQSAVWATRTCLLSTVELLEEDPPVYQPLKSLEDFYKYRGWILQTYRWRIDEDGVTCQGKTVLFPETANREEWERQLLTDVNQASVLLTAGKEKQDGEESGTAGVEVGTSGDLS